MSLISFRLFVHLRTIVAFHSLIHYAHDIYCFDLFIVRSVLTWRSLRYQLLHYHIHGGDAFSIIILKVILFPIACAVGRFIVSESITEIALSLADKILSLQTLKLIGYRFWGGNHDSRAQVWIFSGENRYQQLSSISDILGFSLQYTTFSTMPPQYHLTTPATHDATDLTISNHIPQIFNPDLSPSYKRRIRRNLEELQAKPSRDSSGISSVSAPFIAEWLISCADRI